MVTNEHTTDEKGLTNVQTIKLITLLASNAVLIENLLDAMKDEYDSLDGRLKSAYHLAKEYFDFVEQKRNVLLDELDDNLSKQDVSLMNSILISDYIDSLSMSEMIKNRNSKK